MFIKLTSVIKAPILIRADAVTAVFAAQKTPDNEASEAPSTYHEPNAYVAYIGGSEEVGVMETPEEIHSMVKRGGN